MNNRLIIGRLENINLPNLTINELTVRVDTGAQTSSLHVDNIELIHIDSKPYVEFDIHPKIHDVEQVSRCRAKLHDIRKVKSSNGFSEQRYVIKTTAEIGKFSWDIEISLTDRSDMTYLMLLGREALGAHFYVDVADTFIASNNN